LKVHETGVAQHGRSILSGGHLAPSTRRSCHPRRVGRRCPCPWPVNAGMARSPGVRRARRLAEQLNLSPMDTTSDDHTDVQVTKRWSRPSVVLDRVMDYTHKAHGSQPLGTAITALYQTTFHRWSAKSRMSPGFAFIPETACTTAAKTVARTSSSSVSDASPTNRSIETL